MILTEDPNTADGFATWHCEACNVNSTSLHMTAEAVAVDAMRHNSMHHGGSHKLRSADDRTVSTLPDLDALAAKLWRDGWELNGIADLFGATERAVHTRLLRQGLVEPMRLELKAQRGRPADTRKVHLIREALDNGQTVAGIVRSTGIKQSTVYAIMKREGMKVIKAGAA